MEAKDLRIGNLILYTNSAFGSGKGKVFAIQEKLIMVGDVAVYPTEAKSIPLTEEILIQFGFEQDYNINHWFVKGIFCYKVFNDNCSQVCIKDSEYTIHKVLQVHQLQNLYHALTGEELTIKE